MKYLSFAGGDDAGEEQFTSSISPTLGVFMIMVITMILIMIMTIMRFMMIMMIIIRTTCWWCQQPHDHQPVSFPMETNVRLWHHRSTRRWLGSNVNMARYLYDNISNGVICGIFLPSIQLDPCLYDISTFPWSSSHDENFTFVIVNINHTLIIVTI